MADLAIECSCNRPCFLLSDIQCSLYHAGLTGSVLSSLCSRDFICAKNCLLTKLNQEQFYQYKHMVAERPTMIKVVDSAPIIFSIGPRICVLCCVRLRSLHITPVKFKVFRELQIKGSCMIISKISILIVLKYKANKIIKQVNYGIRILDLF